MSEKTKKFPESKSTYLRRRVAVVAVALAIFGLGAKGIDALQDATRAKGTSPEKITEQIESGNESNMKVYSGTVIVREGTNVRSGPKIPVSQEDGVSKSNENVIRRTDKFIVAHNPIVVDADGRRFAYIVDPEDPSQSGYVATTGVGENEEGLPFVESKDADPEAYDVTKTISQISLADGKTTFIIDGQSSEVQEYESEQAMQAALGSHQG